MKARLSGWKIKSLFRLRLRFRENWVWKFVEYTNTRLTTNRTILSEQLQTRFHRKRGLKRKNFIFASSGYAGGITRLCDCIVLFRSGINNKSVYARRIFRFRVRWKLDSILISEQLRFKGSVTSEFNVKILLFLLWKNDFINWIHLDLSSSIQ